MAKKSMMIDFQLLRTNTYLQAILTDQYIKRDVNGMAKTIGGHKYVNEMQKNLMGLTNNASVSVLNSHNLSYSCLKLFG